MGFFDFLRGRKGKDGLSDAELTLLARFSRARVAEDESAERWDAPLGAPVGKTIRRLIDRGLLAPASLKARLAATLKVPELKVLLRERELPVSGTKPVLIERLVEADPAAAEAAVAGRSLVGCTDEGAKLVAAFRERKNAEHEQASQASLEMIQRGDFAGASRTVAAYEARQVFPRGLGIDWQSHDAAEDVRFLTSLQHATPAILSNLSELDMSALRVATAMMHLWGMDSAKHWLPEGFVGSPRFGHDTAARMLLFHQRHQREIRNLRRIGIKHGRFLGCPNSCDFCRGWTEKKLRLDEIPELPHAGCTHELGCRCVLVSELDD